MKNKYNAGDKVILILEIKTPPYYEVSNEEIESVSLCVDKIEYFFKTARPQALQEDVYTKEEAIDFLKGALGD